MDGLIHGSDGKRAGGPPSALLLINRAEGGVRTLHLEPENLRLLSQVLNWGGYRTQIIDIDDDVDLINDAVELYRPTVVFNLVEHMFGDASQVAAVAGMLDLFGYVYTGSGPRALRDCHDSERSQLLLAKAGVPCESEGGRGGWRYRVFLLGNDERMCLPPLEHVGGKRGRKPIVCDGSESEVQQMEHLARLAWSALGLRDVGRVDLSMTETGSLQVASISASVDILGPSFKTSAAATELGFPGTLVQLCKICHARLPPEELAVHPIPR